VIPIRDINPTTRTAWLTLAVIAANIAIFVLWEPTFAGEGAQQTFLFCNAEISYEVTHQTTLADGGSEARAAIEESFGVGPTDARALQEFLDQRCPDKSWLVSIFVAMFLHGGWLHIAGNMLFLWVFGNNVEDRLGRVAFVALYLVGGLAATGLQLAFDPNSTLPSVGASGAIASILGAYLILFPTARIHTLVIFFFITFVDLPGSDRYPGGRGCRLLGARRRFRVRDRHDVALLPVTREAQTVPVALPTPGSSLIELSRPSCICRRPAAAGRLNDRRAG
jgi:membrane associated rhomboid family serine protease